MAKLWNAEARLTSHASSEASEKLRARIDNDPQLPTVLEHELEPTPFEQGIISTSRNALTQLTERLTLPVTDVPEDHIHILTQEEFIEKISPDAQAKVKYQHLYTPRVEDRFRFSLLMTHELCHAGSAYTLGVIQEADERRLRVWQRKLGMTFQAKPGKDTETSFNGLSEGTTELCAVELRKIIVKKDLGLTDQEAKKLTSSVNYRPWVVLTDALIRFVADAEGVKPKEMRDELMKDYFSGTYHFLKKLSKHQKGAVQILRTAQATPEEALRVADILDLHEAKKEILAPLQKSKK